MMRGRFTHWLFASVVVACGLGACVSTTPPTDQNEQLGQSASAISSPAGIPCAARADAVIANTGQLFSNSGSLVDSYQSSNGAYGGKNIGTSGNVRAAETIVDNGGVIHGTETPNSPADLAIVPVPTGATNLPLGSKTPGSIDITTAAESISLAPGTYVVDNLTVASPGAITISPPGQVLIWVTGSLNLGGNENLNGIPDNFEVLVTSSGPDNVNVNGEFFGFVYAPTSVLNVDSTVFGGVVGATVNLNKGASVHFDQSSVCPVADAGSDASTDAHLDAAVDVAVEADAPHDAVSDADAEAGDSAHDATVDASTDATVDAHDASVDVSVDVSPDVSVEASADAAHDAAVDASADVVADVSVDVSADVVNDVGVGVDAPTCTASNCTPNSACDVAACQGSTCTHTAATNGTACTGTNLCEQAYTCQSGVCTGSNPVVCTASDQCHVAGACNPSTGVCSNPAATNGTACNDGNACDLNDSCQSGTCTAGSSVVCAASDQCHGMGICNPPTGICSNPELANGTACNDGSLCDSNDSCQSGVCTAGSSVVCTASDQCHVAGTCNPATGVCSNPAATNGTVCNDGNACDLNDTCQSGTCTAGSSVTCTPIDACHGAGTCNPSTGTCSNPTNGLCGNGGTIAGPTLNGTVASNLASMAAPLFTQPDGGTGAINLAEVAVVRGHVFSLPSSSPFPGVTVSVLGHPEYGTATTGADGSFNLAVNGGGQITVVYTAPSGTPTYLPVQRHTPSQWQQYAVLPDVYMTPIDHNANPIAMSNATWQAAQGSTITDPADQNGVDGGPPVSPTLPHTARIFFPAGTTASFTYGACSGTSQATCSSGTSGTCAQGSCVSGVCTGAAPASLTVRATEYTVGATGLAAMPAELPPATAYTYAVELSADEELAAGANGVEFNQPVSFYLEDFLGFGPAQQATPNPPIPVGFYDRMAGAWVPAPNGAIIDITGFTGTCPGVGCVAVLNQPANDAGTTVTLSADELAFLGQTYGATATPLYLWRFTTPHFSGGDINWPFILPPGPTPPPTPPLPDPPLPDPDPCYIPGASVIECENAILAQQTPIPGTPYFLRYQSERAPGRLPSLQIPLTGPTWPPTAVPLSVNVQIVIAGRTITLSYPPLSLTPSQTVIWTWDQKDTFGNTVEGLQLATVTVSYVYQGLYTGIPSDAFVAFDSLTSTGSVIGSSLNRALNQASFTTTTNVRIGVEDAAPLGLGGWTISAQHVYDPGSHTFWGGDGKRRVERAPIIQTVPGVTGVGGIVPAVAPDGTLYETAGVLLDTVDSSGNITTIAGAGTVPGPYPACTPLSSALFNRDIQSLAVGPNGLLYEAGNSIVNVIDPVAGTIQTIAGSGQPLTSQFGCQDSATATQGTFGGENFGLAAAPDGSIYVTDETCETLRRIGTDGSLQTVTGVYTFQPGGCSGHSTGWTPGQLASTACLGEPSSVAVAADGTIYLAEYSAFPEVARIDPKTGVISTYAGSPPAGRNLLAPASYDGQLATQIQFAGQIMGVAVGADGTVYASDYAAHALYGVDPTGVIHLVAGGASPLVTTEVDNGPAAGSLLNQPGSLAIDPNRSILVLDNGINGSLTRIRAVMPTYPSYAPGTTAVASADGSEVYVFNSFGQHLSTVDPVTGAILRTFQYDASNRLTSITETRGGTTKLAYSGTTVTITPPFSAGGQQTTLTLDQVGGHAIAMTTPAGETTQLTYSNGLMMSLLDPKSNLHTFAYDAYGRLIQDVDPTKATIGLQETLVTAPLPPDGGAEPLASWSMAVTSAAGHVTTHQDLALSDGTTQRNIFAPSGAASLSTESSAELWTTTTPDGTSTSQQLAPDPQFGMLDPYVGTMTRSTPSGLTYGQTRTRTSTGSPLAPSQIVDLTTMNGTSLWSSIFSAATGSQSAQWTYVSPAGRQRVQQLDNLGRVSSIAYPGTTTLPTTSFVYDADGRVQTVTVTANGGSSARTTSMTYDTYLAGYLATIKDALGNVTTYDQRDNDGRVLDTQLPDFATVPQSHVAMTYDLNGNVASVTVPPATSLSSTHNFTDTPVDLLASYTPPQVSSTTSGTDPELTTLATSYTYNADRLVTAIQVPEGNGFQTVTKGYDTFGRLGSTFDPLSNVTTTYGYATNSSGTSTDQIASLITSDGVTVTNTFDGFLKTQVQWTSGSVAGAVNWTYDNFFRPATLQVGSIGITFAYDPDSLYVGTSSPAFNVTRDVAGSSLDGLPHSATLGTVTESWTYDAFGVVSSYTVQTSDGTVEYAMSSVGVGTSIVRDALGRITFMNELVNGAAHTWTISYDSRGRLETVNRDSTTSTYGYDPNGNLTTINGAPFGTFDAQDRMVSFTPPGGDPWTLAYTNNGDLTAKESAVQAYAFAYDLSSNLRNAQATGPTTATIDYVIDGANRRIGKAVTNASTTIQDGLLYDEQRRVIAELDGSNNVLSTFVYGLKPNVPDYMVRGGTTYRIVSDWRGDVRLVLDTTKTGTAAVVQQIDYDEWGNVTNLVDPACTAGGTELCFQPFGFAGGIWEPATGLVRFGARDYDPLARRWVSKDPIRFDGGLDLYVYSENDPVNSIDPTGEEDGQCIPQWTCVFNGVINTGMGSRCNYTCTNGISTKSVNRVPTVKVFCAPAAYVAALLNDGIITP
jgi:RHS repeat-associated protein